MNIFPNAKSSEILQQSSGAELLIYNVEKNQAFCLNQTSTIIYNLCDGTNEISLIAKKTQFPLEVVQLAVNTLSKQGLLTEEVKLTVSRRNLLRNVAITSVVLPIIETIVAPISAHAASSDCLGTGTFAPGQLFATIPSDAVQVLRACVQPACSACQSCRVHVGSSNCASAGCATVNCYCADPRPAHVLEVCIN